MDPQPNPNTSSTGIRQSTTTGRPPSHYHLHPSFDATRISPPRRPRLHNVQHHPSHVSVDYFDHDGVLHLTRTLSNISHPPPLSHAGSSRSSPGHGEGDDGSHSDSEPTLDVGEDVDFEQIVRNYLKLRDKSEIKPRTLGVVFSDLRVVGLGASASFQPTLGSFLNPLILFKTLLSLRHPPLRDIITNFEGVVRPGEMLLVLGRPGSGCTTFLKLLANHRSGYHSISGHISYDSHTPKEIAKHYRGDVQYCPENDEHFPTLTVDQTIHFAAKTRAPQERVEGQTRGEYTRLVADLYETIFGLGHVKNTVVGDASIRGISGGEKKRVSISETMATRSLITSWDNSTRGLDSSTALEYVRALRIGTDLAKLATIVSIYQAGESLFNLFDKVCLIYEGRMVYYGPGHLARAYFEDMGYVPANRQTTPDFLVGVTDPKGRVVRGQDEGRERGSGNGKGGAGKGLAGSGGDDGGGNGDEDGGAGSGSNGSTDGSSTAGGSGNGNENDSTQPTRKPIPQTPLEFEQYYRASEIFRMNAADVEDYRAQFASDAGNTTSGGNKASGGNEASHGNKASGGKDASALKEGYKESARQEHARHTRPRSSYTISIPMQVRIVMVRRAQIMKGSFLAQGLQTTTFVLQAIIIGTTFIRVPDDTSAYFSRGGVIFFSVFLPALFSMSEIPALFAQRRIIHRHELAAMYHPMVESLALTLVDIPFTFVTMVLFTIILYFIVQLQQTAGQFFIYFLFVFTISITFKAFFRGLAAMFPSEAPAQALAGVLLLALSLYAGYQIPRPSMIGALRWISYINPTLYAFDSLMTNEFHTLDGTCANLVPSGPGYGGVGLANQACPVVGAQPGQDRVDGSDYLALSFEYYHRNLWRNYGILVAFGIFFLLCLLVFSEFNTRVAGDRAVILFKRGTRPAVVEEAEAAVGPDEEKDQQPGEKGGVMAVADEATLASSSGSSGGKEADGGKEKDGESGKDGKNGKDGEKRAGVIDVEAVEAQDALKEQPKMTNVFSWDHLRYIVSVAGEKKVLLDDVSGYVAPGKLTALMGESGAGKTTLLNVLAERTDTGVITGDRFFNGQALPPDFQSQTGYCQQMDTHVGNTTVREALRFSARLRQPSDVPTAEKDEYVEKCLKMCGLEPFADAMVGTLGVEQKKRTTIGVELAAKPKLLLFLDEPTSGLDSQSAWAIVSFLRTLADNGQAILCTIHQPSAELFEVFDRLLLLKKGGQVVFFGDIGTHASSLINYFESNGGRKCSPEENPAEYMLDIIGAGATAVTDRDWNDVWVQSEECARAKEELKQIHEDGRKSPPVAATLKSTFATPWIYQASFVLQRSLRTYWRDPTYLMSKLTLNIIGGLFIGFTFFKSKDTVQDTQNKLFAIFMATILSAPLGGQLHVPYIKMRDIYEIRERSSRMYHWTALVASQILVELPWNILGSSLFFCCWYWTVGFRSSRGAYTYLMYGFLFPTYYTTIALAVASMCATAEIASLMFSFLFSFVLTFDGVVQPYRQLGWWRWMYHLSPYTYLIEGVVGQGQFLPKYSQLRLV
ncbi:multidrug resistance protein 1, variant 2 [Coprinopsis cinerea AmutBmut pab1-1]|nr:multidrug resistance protein 1, variant 2 [Coprinopsis cinerea AmutBmut pab1-1]